jgi:hypothetical protein
MSYSLIVITVYCGLLGGDNCVPIGHSTYTVTQSKEDCETARSALLSMNAKYIPEFVICLPGSAVKER